MVMAGVAVLGLRATGIVPVTQEAVASPVRAPAAVPVALHAAEPCPIDARWGESWVQPLIACEAAVWQVPGGARKALAVARCESRFVVDAFNPTGCGGSGCGGLFQQSMRYWAGRAAQYGFGGVPPDSVRANVVVSMRMASERGTWARDWPFCGR